MCDLSKFSISLFCRNGRLFQYVLDFLRGSDLHLPDSESEKLQAQLRKEADFYQIPALIKALNKLRDRVAPRKGWIVELYWNIYTGDNEVSIKSTADFFAHCAWSSEAEPVLSYKVDLHPEDAWYLRHGSPNVMREFVSTRNCFQIEADLRSMGATMLPNCDVDERFEALHKWFVPYIACDFCSKHPNHVDLLSRAFQNQFNMSEWKDTKEEMQVVPRLRSLT